MILGHGGRIPGNLGKVAECINGTRVKPTWRVPPGGGGFTGIGGDYNEKSCLCLHPHRGSAYAGVERGGNVAGNEVGTVRYLNGGGGTPEGIRLYPADSVQYGFIPAQILCPFPFGNGSGEPREEGSTYA